MESGESFSGPVFVCGASRSGTALMRSALNNHSRVHLAGETHYFDDLRERMKDRLGQTLTPDERREAEDYFLAIGHRPYGHKGDPEQSRVPRERLRELAQGIGGDSDALFEAFCRGWGEAEGKPGAIWGEKTPRHIFRVDDILQKYPGARIICMVRDGRAVVASYRDWKNQGGFDFEKDPGHKEELERDHERARRSYDILIASTLWRGTANAAVRARDRWPDNVYVQKYEDLVASPEESLRRIAEWLGVGFEPAMLDVPMHNSSFSTYSASGGIRKEATDRWKTKLSAREIGVIQFVCGRTLSDLDYALEPVPTPWLTLAHRALCLPAAVVRAARANRKRIGNLPAYIWRRCMLAAGAR